jgi:LysM repeat protein
MTHPLDEGDFALKTFTENGGVQNSSVIEEEGFTDLHVSDSTLSQPSSLSTSTSGTKISTDPSVQYVDVKVKRGDSLDKLARANGTSVKAIRDANQLNTDRLHIGQVLHIPVKDKEIKDKKQASPSSSTKATASVTSSEVTPSLPKGSSQASADPQKATSSTSPEYYTIKNGDNPWKIAKQFNLKIDDLLKLNGLDEDKARTLKAGDKIRIH